MQVDKGVEQTAVMSMKLKNDQNGKVSKRCSSSTYLGGDPQLSNGMSVMFNKRIHARYYKANYLSA